MRCQVPGGALYSAKLPSAKLRDWRTRRFHTSSETPYGRYISSRSACRTPTANRTVAVLAIPDVAEIQLDLAREEELVRRRKERYRSASGLEDRKPVARPQRHRIAVRASRQTRTSARPGPCRARSRVSRVGSESLEPGLVFVGDRRLLSLGDGFLPQQVRSLIHGEHQLAGEDAQKTRKARSPAARRQSSLCILWHGRWTCRGESPPASAADPDSCEGSRESQAVHPRRRSISPFR